MNFQCKGSPVIGWWYAKLVIPLAWADILHPLAFGPIHFAASNNESGGCKQQNQDYERENLLQYRPDLQCNRWGQTDNIFLQSMGFKL